MKTIILISYKTSRKLLKTLIIFELLLVFSFIVNKLIGSPHVGINNILNLDGEYSLPALFSFGQLFLCSLIFISISYIHKNHLQLALFRFFFIVGLGFLFLAFDEFFSIHEEISSLMKTQNNVSAPHFKNGHGYWILPYLLICLLFLIFTYKVIRNIFYKYRKESMLITLGGAIFLFGGVCLEIISYEYILDKNVPGYFYTLEVIFEEFLEMLGISIILFSSLLIRSKTQKFEKGNV